VRRRGSCPNCNGRLNKSRWKDTLCCPTCEANGADFEFDIKGVAGSTYRIRRRERDLRGIRVVSHKGRQSHKFFASEDAVIRMDGGSCMVADVMARVGDVHVIQDERHFRQLNLDGVLAVRGVTTPSFPRDLDFLSAPTFDLFYELAHYSRLGECDVVRFAWWANKFKPDLGRSSAERAWDRLKTHLRSVGVGISLEPGKAFRFDDPSGFVSGVMDVCVTEEDEEWA
jgi:hypothetical protein